MTNWGFTVWVAALGTLILASLLNSWRRAKSMAALADRLGLKMWGNQLPPELCLTGTPFAQVTSTSNVMEGKQNGVAVIAFDCRIGSGKYSWRRTVIAAQSNRDVFATVLSGSSYTTDRCGDWIVLYAPKRGHVTWRSLMPIAELEARLSSLQSY